ncbi:ABC transporter permease [Nonomuraea sp. NPDC050328]|uniref:ABC transporter permease n=1 Tax=Nonomuraea sp. NPDC050328 TaxID=3364361 RepID=UPI0037874A0E
MTTLLRPLHAEWIKLRSLRSTWTVLGVAAGTVGAAALMAYSAVQMWNAASPEQRATARMTGPEDVVIMIPQLCLGILGVLAMTGETPATFLATPRRPRVLAAKAGVLALTGLVTGLGTIFASAWVARPMVAGRFALEPLAEKVPLLLAYGTSVMVFGLLGLGLAALLRSTAGAVAVLVGLVYVVPMIVGNLPEPWSESLGSVMIGALPGQLTGDDLTNSVYGSALSPPLALLALAGYALVPLAVGGWALARRDV